jgi:membrane associated rhomboid family serine protease
MQRPSGTGNQHAPAAINSISNHYTQQFWRLISRSLAFTASVDLVVAILVLYHSSTTLERRYGTAKFVSFALVSTFFGTALEVASLTLLRALGVGIESLPAGPFTFIFALLFNYSRSVPSSYTYKVFGASFTSKSLLYLLSAQLAFASPPNSLVSAGCGVLAGIMYRSNILGSRTWRIPQWVQKLGRNYLTPLLGSSRMPRRSARTSLEDSENIPGAGRSTPGPAAPRPGAAPTPGAIAEVVQTL